MVRIVRPPSFEAMREELGGTVRAIRYLVEAGYTTDQIVRRSGLPYHLVELYKRGIVPANRYPFREVTRYYDRIATVRSKRGKKTVLVRFFKNPNIDFATKVRLALGRIVEERTTGVGPAVVERAIAFASGRGEGQVRRVFIDYGDYGEVAYLLCGAASPRITVGEVCEAIRLLPKLRRIDERVMVVSSLLRSSVNVEARYVVHLILQDLKLGFHEATVIDAVSEALGLPPELVRQVCAIKGISDGLTLAVDGRAVLEGVKLRPGEFIRPQLAHLYEPDKVAFPCRVEWKYDGSRLQLHKWGETVVFFSRRGIEKSKTLPEVMPIIKGFNAQSCIVDSEVVALDRKGRPLPFQYMLKRTVPRELKEEVFREIRLSIKAFDILYLNGESLMDKPLRERLRFLGMVVPDEYQATAAICGDELELMDFYQEALRQGLEGIIVKDLGSVYEAGRRTYTWLKLKPERDTVDCVVVKALYGKGRRAGLYSSFELAVRHPTERKLFTIGRVANLPEGLLASIASQIDRLKTGEDREGAFVRPGIVLEVTYQEIERAKEYTSGYALRVPKFVRLRDDKTVEEIDTVKKIERLYELQYERFPAKELPEF
ncbi:TPA: ATP-dependent DNA ligase [Candidatus Bathyarchaeota archaeon]|nr:ATP-dependent DNA ligase [Candidatus Bathyarchaeota archaeon]